MVDGVWSGGTYVCWGIDNREAPVRLCNASSPASRNFEIKCLDGMANPYLALAGILGVGHAGIRDATSLEMQDCSGSLSAAELGDEGRKALGITQRMPLTWQEARVSLCNDPVVISVLGDELLKKYLDVNKVSLQWTVNSAVDGSLPLQTLAEALDQGRSNEDKLKLLVENY
jgi:glutamine synthetase